MSFVATAIVGSAVVGGIATSVGSKRASEAAQSGADSAAQATIASTEMQIAEIQRQFDFQQQLLAPFVANQYAAQSAYQDLLGIGGGAGSQPTPSGPTGAAPVPAIGPGGGSDYFRQPDGRIMPGGGGQVIQGPVSAGVDPRVADIDRQIAELQGQGPRGSGPSRLAGQAVNASRIAELENQRRTLTAGGPAPGAPAGGPTAPQYPGSGSTTFQRGPNGEFLDKNIDPTRLADVNTLGDEVRGNLLADTNLQDDSLYQDVIGRSLSDGAAATSVYGDTFEESPGYAFQVEEMDRALDRRNSAGGNYGGRAVMEAQRRAQGLAAGEYYNWAQGRSRDVDRLTTAEARDASRVDSAGVNYFNRRAGDASRLDAAASQEDRLMAVDQQRRDQAYYNYLANVGAAGGVGGNAVGQAVNSSAAAGQGAVNAYGNQGNNLTNIASQLGTDRANIAGSTAASYNDIIQGGLSNAVTAGLIG